jgi:hypothetical protein
VKPTFASTFGELVTPELARMCRVQGFFVALERRSFPEAFDTVWRVALRRGALMLPERLLNDLEGWIMTRILLAEKDARPGVEERRAVADRVAKDIERTEAMWQ